MSYSYRQASKGGRTTARLHRRHDEDVIVRAEAGSVTDEALRIAKRRTTEARASLRWMITEAAYPEAAQRALDSIAGSAGSADIETLVAAWLAAIDAVDDAEDGLREDVRAGRCTWPAIAARVKALNGEREAYSTALFWARHESILRAAAQEVAA